MNKIILNVGGHRFETTFDTMNIHPYFRRLADEVRDRPEREKHIFIDRDGTHFRRILNYLRTSHIVFPDDSNSVSELMIELDFYGIQSYEVRNHVMKSVQTLQDTMNRIANELTHMSNVIENWRNN